MRGLFEMRLRLLAELRGSRPGLNVAQGRLPITLLELQIAKEILGEIFDVTPRDVDEMIERRVVETGCQFCPVTTPPQ